MIDFNLIKELSVVEGNVVKIENEISQVIWQKNVKYDRPIKLGVEKVTATTYAGETAYENEQFILLDIYPETADSIINVTYEGLTKTLTFNGTNAKQVYFGTFNGVSDSVSTPSSGIVTIEGQCIGFGCSSYYYDNKSSSTCSCIIQVYDFGNINIIPTNAFYGCTSLELTELPINITTIGNFAFYDCANLALTSLPSGITSIGNNVFYGCTNLALTSLPNDITAIGSYAFYGCTNLALAELPSEITSIKNYTFYNCTNIALTSLPSGLTSIGDYAFNRCWQNTFNIFPEGLTSIGTQAFFMGDGWGDTVGGGPYVSPKVKDIILPSTLTSISGSCFAYAGSYYTQGTLNTVEILALTPPTIDMAFGKVTSSKFMITVPKGCGEIYKTSEGWSKYADRIVEAS